MATYGKANQIYKNDYINVIITILISGDIFLGSKTTLICQLGTVKLLL